MLSIGPFLPLVFLRALPAVNECPFFPPCFENILFHFRSVRSVWLIWLAARELTQQELKGPDWRWEEAAVSVKEYTKINSVRLKEGEVFVEAEILFFVFSGGCKHQQISNYAGESHFRPCWNSMFFLYNFIQNILLLDFSFIWITNVDISRLFSGFGTKQGQ